MKVRILIRQKIEGEAGTVCDVEPARASFLLQYGAAERVEAGEQVEIPEARKNPTAVKAAPAKAAKTASKKKESK